MGKPGQFLPRHSGPHRIACIALYRALLSHIPSIPLPADLLTRGPVNPIKYYVRKHFKKNASLTSKKLCVERLKEAYAVENLLGRAATGDQSSTSDIHGFLSIRHQTACLSRLTCGQPAPKPSRAHLLRAYPGARRITDARPLPLSQISSGVRHVPSMAIAQNHPMLRFKKHQSPYLSRILQDKRIWGQKQTDKQSELEIDVEMAEHEENWEEEILKVAVKGKRPPEREKVLRLAKLNGIEGMRAKETWYDALEAEQERILRAIRRDHMEAKKMGNQLTMIRRREIQLKEEEMQMQIKEKEAARETHRRAVEAKHGIVKRVEHRRPV